MKSRVFDIEKNARICGKLLLIGIFISNKLFLAKSHEAVLRDTRMATSDLGWAKSPGSKWQDLSSPHPDGSERRNLQVCEIKTSKQNNWVRSPFIPVDGAKRVYVEFEFTIRSCDDLTHVATCKETFNLYYFESDEDDATSTFPPWNEEGYKKVDTVAADQRFHPGSNVTNYETRDIGPLRKKGIYIALQDTGACIAIMHMRVYYKYCASTDQNLANFPKTNAGPERTSLIETTGTCVENALNENNELAILHCNSDGQWTVTKGRCICNAGYSPSTDGRSCQSCGRGLYKPQIGNQPCQRCPAYSRSIRLGAKVCDCMIGYYRAVSDPEKSPCSKPPSKPTNLQVSLNQTKAILTWDFPLNDGGRDDVTFRIECLQCQTGFSSCSRCPGDISFMPSQKKLKVTKVKVQDIHLFSFYKFIVYAENGVSDVSGGKSFDINYAIITLLTPNTKLSVVTGLTTTDIGPTSCHVTWNRLIGGEKYLEYDVRVGDVSKNRKVQMSTTKNSTLKIQGLSPNRDYTIEVRAKRRNEHGPFTVPIIVHTRPLDVKFIPDDKEYSFQFPLQVVVGVIVGVMCIIAVIIITSFLTRRRKKFSGKTSIALEKYPMLNTNTLLSSGMFFGGRKTYVDPTTYENPQNALLDFTKELDASCISIEATIGGGEFGDVCRGHILLGIYDSKQEVAIKTLKCGSTPEEKLNFLTEASIMGQFDHPNVIRLEGVVTKSLPLMIITEFMDNGSLDNFLRSHDGEFSVLQLVGMLRHIAAGMKYLADMGFVHRDLAARNVLVNEQMVCKVSDFGLSRVLEEDDDATYTTRGGKIPIRWTAPEAITHRKFTSASDVWSFGIVIWEVMSYGERPYWGMSNNDVIAAVGTGYRLPAPMECPLIQHQLMLDCWKKNRSDRPKFCTILATLDRMLRDPTQLHTVASLARNCKSDCFSDEEICESVTPQSHTQHVMNSYHSITRQSKHGEHTQSSSLHLSSLGVWLESIGLSEYKENFLQRGYCLMEQLMHCNSSDLDNFGITNPQHQKIFFENINSLKMNSLQFRQSLEDNLNGIPV